MEDKLNIFTNKCVPQKDKEKKSRDKILKNTLGLKIVNNKFSENNRNLQNFFTNKNKFKSYFDRKGAEKFLKEKAKAMEEIVLMDEIQEEKAEQFNEKSKKYKSQNKYSKKFKHLRLPHSKKELFYLEKRNSSKKQVYEENKNDSFLSFKNANNINNKIEIQNANNLKGLADSTKKKNKLSVIIIREPSFLLTGDNDSFIYSLVREMNESKNYSKSNL
jgi:hypothetical protein